MREGKQISTFNVVLTVITGTAIISACIYMVVQYRDDNAVFLSGEGFPVYLDTAELGNESLWDQRFVQYDSLCTLDYADREERSPDILVPCRRADTVHWMIAVMKHTGAGRNVHYGRLRVSTPAEKKQVRLLTGQPAHHLYIFDPGITPDRVRYRIRMMALTGAALSLIFIAAGIYLVRRRLQQKRRRAV